MDPWTRFDRALQTMEDPTLELHQVIRDLDSTDIGEEADRQELRACVVARLAGAHELPFDEALREVQRSEALNRAGWPNLYLTMAVMRRDRPQMALDAASRVPSGYFEALDFIGGRSNSRPSPLRP